MSNFCIIVLAAGEGKRMKSDCPKVLHKIGSRPMIDFVVEAARKTSPKKIIVVVARKRLQVKEALKGDIKVAIQEKQLGTADAVRSAVRDIPPAAKDVIVLYGDTPLITPETVNGLYNYHIEHGASCTVLTTFLENPKGYGRILRNEAGNFIGIIE
ncbi:MAG TPA: NTP transferase domain-containing protein, partial [Candidatus Omnitrophota bacterium]|nr:NTP transferase domain-containing protein [Candidatus Omnitrophota bacterium]